MKIIYKNLLFLLCFLIIIFIVSNLWSLLRSLKVFDQNKLSVPDLKSVLKYRGIELNDVIEKRDLWELINSTGKVTDTELNLARDYIRNEGNCFSDSAIVIPSEELFNELVEDTKDSAWILMTIFPKSSQHVGLSDRIKIENVWCYIQSVFLKFGINMAILDCGKLYNLCWDRGFHRSPFVLLLPRGSGKVKDSMDFFVFPYSLSQLRNDMSFQYSVAHWLRQRLANRVVIHNKFSTQSDWLLTNFISIYHQTPSSNWSGITNKGRPFRQVTHRLLDTPSLAISGQSVKFIGQVKFFLGFDFELPSSLKNRISRLNSKTETSNGKIENDSNYGKMDHFFITHTNHRFGDSFWFNNRNDNSSEKQNYGLGDENAENVFVYQYGKHKGETLSFESLQLFLRHMCPSTNDIFIWNLVLVNVLISFQAAFQHGSLALRIGYYLWYFLIFNLIYCCAFLFILSALSFSPLLAKFNYYLLMLWRRLALTRFVNHLRYLQLNQDIDLVLFLATWSLFVLIIGKFHKDGDDVSASNGSSNANSGDSRNVGGNFSDTGSVAGSDSDYNSEHARNLENGAGGIEMLDAEAGRQIAVLTTLGTLNLRLQQQPPLYISKLLKWSFQVPKKLASKLASRYKGKIITACNGNSVYNKSLRNMVDELCLTSSASSSTPSSPECRPLATLNTVEQYDNAAATKAKENTTGDNSNIKTVTNESNNNSNTINGSKNSTSSLTNNSISKKANRSTTAETPTSTATEPTVQWPVGYIFTDECCICLQRYRRDEILCGLPCGHAFHDHCIYTWLIQRAKDDCPQCRWPAYKNKP